MRRTHRAGRLVSCVVCFGMIVSPLVSWAQAPKVLDVTLSSEGKLVGQVVNADGNPVAGEPIVLLMKRTAVSKTTTDLQGRFGLVAPRSGVFTVVVVDRVIPVRAWRAEIAPPAARASLLCVTTESTVRGQQLMSVLRNPWVIGLGIAAAIAIPIALNDDDDKPSGS